jgi:hypothetical protein
MSADRAAIARLQRLRWSLTVSYTAGAAVCLIVLVFIAAAIDTHSRAQALDTDAGRRADAFSRAVWMDKGVLHLEPLSEDELAGAPAVTAVLERTGPAPSLSAGCTRSVRPYPAGWGSTCYGRARPRSRRRS